MLEQAVILLQIIFIDIILAADNAIIIGLIAANFAPKNRKQIILWGVAGALIFKIIFALFATYLFEYYFIKILGGLLLIWIVNDLRKDLFEIKKIKSPTTPMTLSKLIIMSANKTLKTLSIKDGSLDFLVGDFIFLISNKSFRRSFTIHIKSRPPRIFIK